MKIPFHKPYISEEEIGEVVDSIRSGWLTMGPKTERFEKSFAEFLGVQSAIAVNSCTAALHLALKAVDLRMGDEVIIPAMTFTSTGEVVTYFNAKPVLVDVDTFTHNIDIAGIESRLTSRTKVIIPVHYGGQPCDMDEITALALERGIYVVEDAAHALPASYKGRMIGTIGDITCFSFYATKTLATGEGGMIVTGNHEWEKRMRTLRLHGISQDAWKRYSDEGSWYYEVIEAGYKYNMTDLEAALGIAQLARLEWMQQRRERIADIYGEAFGGNEYIIPPLIKPDRTSSWHLYPIKLRLEALRIDRNAFMEELKERGVGTSVHFIPLYRHPFYRDTFGYGREDFPSCEWLFERQISLPIYPGITDDEAGYVIESVDEICRAWKK